MICFLCDKDAEFSTHLTASSVQALYHWAADPKTSLLKRVVAACERLAQASDSVPQSDK